MSWSLSLLIAAGTLLSDAKKLVADTRLDPDNANHAHAQLEDAKNVAYDILDIVAPKFAENDLKVFISGHAQPDGKSVDGGETAGVSVHWAAPQPVGETAPLTGDAAPDMPGEPEAATEAAPKTSDAPEAPSGEISGGAVPGETVADETQPE